MKEKIAILGSTGSIGKSLIKIISNNKKNFEIVLLTAIYNLSLIVRKVVGFHKKVVEWYYVKKSCLLIGENC